jgi:hypothetical protein
LHELINDKKSNDQINLEKNKQKFNKILISNLIPLPAEFLAGFLTNFSFLGRRSLIFIGFLLMEISSIWMFFDIENIYLSSSLINFWSVISYNITKLYTCEVYNIQV